MDSRFGPTAVLGVPAEDRSDEVIARRLGIEPEDGAGARAGRGRGARDPHGTPAGGSLQGRRLHDLPAALVGNADPDRVLREVRDRAGARASSSRCCCRWTCARPGPGNPLAELEEFVNTTCPACGGAARRETDTLDCHFDALWLWIPACVPPQERDGTLEQILALPDLRHWLPSERLVAGSDSGNFVFDQRIVTKALRDIGPLAFLADGEPFAGCLFHEMVIRDGRKMSKHLGNVVDPDELVERYGADTVRLAVLYAARPQRSLNWSDSAVLRCHRFLTERVGLHATPSSTRPPRGRASTAPGGGDGRRGGEGQDRAPARETGRVV